MTETRTEVVTDLYSQEDVQQILQIALARQSSNGELSRRDLNDIAHELGISPETLQAAEQEWLLRRDLNCEQQAFDAYRYRDFQQHLTKYLIVNTFLLLLNLLTVGSVSWALYPILGWGLGLALHGWRTYSLSGEEYTTAFEKWCRRRQFKRSMNRILDRILR